MKMLSVVLVVAAGWLATAAAAAEDPWVQHGIVPDVVDAAPAGIVEVHHHHPQDVTVRLGHEMTPTAVQNMPVFSWPAEQGALYTLVFTDPDAPSRAKPTVREFVHMVVINIPGNDVAKGDILFDYVGAGPPLGSGFHRYVFFVYKQPGHINFNQKTVSSSTFDGRMGFSTRKFAAEKNLGAPVAGNFYVCQYDDYVPTLLAILGVKLETLEL